MSGGIAGTDPRPSEHRGRTAKSYARTVAEGSTLVKSALDYARHGWPIFPIIPGTKKPMTAHGFKDATTDILTVKRWWGDHPTANIGLRTGSASGVFALDGDLYKNPDAFRSLERYGSLPETRTVLTPRRGEHRLFRMPQGEQIRCSQGRLGSGLDVKADGGYVLAPTSCTADGRYELLNSVPLAPPPQWLLRLLLPSNRAKEPAQEGYITTSDDSVDSVQCLAQAIQSSIPATAHANNQALFRLARALKGLPIALAAAQKVAAFDQWYAQTSALGFLRKEQSRDDYLGEFLHAWACAKWALGELPVNDAWDRAIKSPLPPEAAIFESRERKLLIALCYQLEISASGKKWFLASRTAAKLLSIPQRTAAFWIKALITIGVLEVVEPCTETRAPRYRYKPFDGGAQ